MSKSKQYFYVFLLVYSNISFTTSKEIPKAYGNETMVNKTEKVKLNSPNNNSIIPSEGGGKIIVQHVLSSSSTPASTIEKTSTKNTTTISTLHLNGSTIEKNPISSTSSTTTTTENIKPVSESEEIVGDSKVKPRKGVTFSEPIPVTVSTNTTNTTKKADILKVNSTSSSTTTSTSTTTASTTTTSTTTTTTTKKPTIKVFIPHKPTVTISSDDDIPAKSPPKLFVNGKEILPKNYTNSPPKLITDNNPTFISRRTDKGPDYVLPIVLTILSVPLLAIIFTVVYKRGSEWWHHRHYRRMDFLIDGMYNN